MRKLPPGHTLVWEDGGCGRRAPYWQMPRARPGARRSPTPSWRPSCGRGSSASVEAQLVSDVPVGIFLSGGIDSSLRGGGRGRARAGAMKAFSIGFEDATFDETSYARMVAEQLDVEHVSETLHEREPARRAWTRRWTSSTSRWPIRRSCRPSCCRGWRPAT